MRARDDEGSRHGCAGARVLTGVVAVVAAVVIGPAAGPAVTDTATRGASEQPVADVARWRAERLRDAGIAVAVANPSGARLTSREAVAAAYADRTVPGDPEVTLVRATKRFGERVSYRERLVWLVETETALPLHGSARMPPGLRELVERQSRCLDTVVVADRSARVLHHLVLCDPLTADQAAEQQAVMASRRPAGPRPTGTASWYE